MNKDKTIKLSDIAGKLNVSTVTISKALRDHPDISLKTRKLVKETAESMGYTPNFMARNLSARKSNMIGVIIPKIAHYFFGSIIESIYDIAFENNYEIILTVSQENSEREKKHIQTLLSMKVDGIIMSISETTKDYSIFETVKKRGIPIVYMDRIPKLQDIDTVVVDDHRGAFMAVEHAINLGYRNIAHFAGSPEITIGHERIRGYKDALAKHDIALNPDWLIRGGLNEEDGYNAFMQLYRQGNLPDFILTVTYPVALGIYRAVAELGLKIPEDVDLIAFGNANVQNFLNPPLSYIYQPTDLIAKKTMEIVFNKINNLEDSSFYHAEVPTELILRGTGTELKNKK